MVAQIQRNDSGIVELARNREYPLGMPVWLVPEGVKQTKEYNHHFAVFDSATMVRNDGRIP